MTDPHNAPHAPSPAPAADAIDPWAPTRAMTGMAATQVMDMGHDRQTPEVADVGRIVSADRRELHVSC